MTYYHAVFEDECGGEFGAGVEAGSKDEAYKLLREDYPESRIVQMESPEDTRSRAFAARSTETTTTKATTRTRLSR